MRHFATRFYFFFIFLFIAMHCHLLHAISSSEELVTNLFAEGITVDLKEPCYSDGVLTTEKGGVIVGPCLRIQARCISYVRKMIDDIPVFNVVAEGDLILEYNDYVFVGDKLEYDFQTRTGIMYNGRTAVEPWYFGGAIIRLQADGNYSIENGFITTSQNCNPEWQLHAAETCLVDDQNLYARNVQVRIFSLPVFWIPTFNINLDAIFDPPVKYRMRWGGSQGPRVGILYRFFSWERFKAFLRLDYRFTRGPGGGIETEYISPENNMLFNTSNYIARDSSIENPNEKVRYRFEGLYRHCLYDNALNIKMSWDKLSDSEMETNYFERGLELETARRTQLAVRHQWDDLMISNFFTRVRINNFQTVKQELPTLGGHIHPLSLGDTGIIVDNRFEVGYLDFAYNKDNLINVNDYNSTRLEYRNRIYRPFVIYPYIVHTPEVGFVGIHYGNSPTRDAKTVVLGTFGYEVNTHIARIYGSFKHALEPYAGYHYYTFPTTNPSDHFIFDITDGWSYLNTMRFGFRNLIYLKNDCGIIRRVLYADLFTYSFFDTTTLPTIPKVYSHVVWDVASYLRETLDAAWDFEHNQLDHINLRTEYTVNDDLAFAVEYRHRDDFSWRKADPFNFVLESFRTQAALRASSLSDRRDTLLMHAFYRFQPNWALEFESRQGWNRRLQPHYTEYEIDLLTTLGTAWHFKFSYQHLVSGSRFAVYVNVGLKKPKELSCCYYNE